MEQMDAEKEKAAQLRKLGQLATITGAMTNALVSLADANFSAPTPLILTPEFGRIVHRWKLLPTDPVGMDEKMKKLLDSLGEESSMKKRRGYPQKVPNYESDFGRGFTKKVFDEIVEHARVVIQKEKLTWRCTEEGNVEFSCYVMLYWLRTNLKFKHLGPAFKISRSESHRIVMRYLVILRCALHHVPSDPTSWDKHAPIVMASNAQGKKMRCIGSLDCTTCFRNRRHPGSHLLYRGDHGKHALSVQVLVDWEGRVLDVVVAQGRMNDYALVGMCGVRGVLKENHFAVFADGGYEQEECIITPECAVNKLAIVTEFNEIQASMRSGVECVNSFLKNWDVLANRCRLSPEYHAMAIFVAANLHNLRKKHHPTKALTAGAVQQVLASQKMSDILVNGPRIIRGKTRDGELYDVPETMTRRYHQKMKELEAEALLNKEVVSQEPRGASLSKAAMEAELRAMELEAQKLQARIDAKKKDIAMGDVDDNTIHADLDVGLDNDLFEVG